MKIAVVQRHIENIIGIKLLVEKIDTERANEILFTTDPGEVVDYVRDGEPILIVSGQIFAEAGEASGIIMGTQLAKIVKKINPRAMFFIYSTMPESNSWVDGIIPKPLGTASSGWHPLLLKILVVYEEGMTVTDLKKIFPQIWQIWIN